MSGLGVLTLGTAENLCVTYSWPFIYVIPQYARFHVRGFNQPWIV